MPVKDNNQRMSFRSKDLVIAVMGITGVGKSTFISYFSQDAQIGAGLESCKWEDLRRIPLK